MNPRMLGILSQILLPALFALGLAAPAAADPPGQVGRIAWMSGTVQVRNSDTGEWSTAVLNWPLTNGDALSTGPGARLEISIGSTKVRLDSGSELSIDQIDDDRVRLYLANGSATVRLRSRESAREFEFATRDGRFTSQDVGAFRFDHAQNVTSATPYMGTLHFEAEDSALDIPSGQRAQFWYAGRTAYSFSNPVRDDFSEWSIARDQRQDTRNTRRYVSSEMTGYEDLAGYGNWYDSVDYGPVWYPSVVSAGWAPYREGHWAWVAPWGWTWIDDAPWGFAPFHYGRWVWYRDRWGWTPGRNVLRPVYAPALVAWVGTPHLSIGVSSGPAVGWFPLAPREVYVPSYRCSPTYVRNVNITHVTHIENVTQIINDPHRVMERTNFVNRHLPQAVTVVPADVVTQHRPVGPAVEHNRNPRFLETIDKQPTLVQAPVAAPPLPPRVDPDKRDRRGDNPRERRPDGDRPTNDRRFAPPGAPLPAPLNANSPPAGNPQVPANAPPQNNRRPNVEPSSAEPPRMAEPAPNPRFNRPPLAQPAPGTSLPQGPATPATPQPPPNNRRPNTEPPTAEQPRSPDTSPNANPRFNRPPQPAPAPATTPPMPEPKPRTWRADTMPDDPRRPVESTPPANSRVYRTPQPQPQPPAATPSQAMPPPHQPIEREPHNPPRQAVRNEPMPAAPSSPPPPPRPAQPPVQRSQPMPARESQPAPAPQPQSPHRESAERSQPAPAQVNQPQNNPRHKDEGEQRGRENR